jgi:hypothetical protein
LTKFRDLAREEVTMSDTYQCGRAYEKMLLAQILEGEDR